MNKHLLILVALPLYSSLPASAEIFPLPAERLHGEADAIVIATVQSIRIQSEPATFDRAFGNSDWGIYLTLKVESVERGTVAGHTLEARCFRTRMRRFLGEYATPSGHHPIPEAGTRVKAFLKQNSSGWSVVLPNGLEPIGGTGSDAETVSSLSSRRFTYLLPLEVWLVLLVLSLPVIFCLRLFKQRRRSAESAQV